MSTEQIKETIKIKTERFKLYVLILVAITSGLVSMLLSEKNIDAIRGVLFTIGFFFLMLSALLCIKSKYECDELINKL